MKQSRCFGGVLYPDSTSYDFDSRLLLLESFFDDFAYICHDKDLDSKGNLKKSHVHWVGRFKNPRTLSGISGFLGIPEHEIEVLRSWRLSCQYLIHLNDKDKFQYDSSLVHSNFDFSVYLSNSNSESEQAQMIINHIWQDGCSSINSLASWSIQNGCWSAFRRGFSVYSSILAEYKSF